MKKNKLKLNDLNVVSFATSEANSLKGGTGGEQSENCHSWYNGRPVFCKPPPHTEDCSGN